MAQSLLLPAGVLLIGIAAVLGFACRATWFGTRARARTLRDRRKPDVEDR